MQIIYVYKREKSLMASKYISTASPLCANLREIGMYVHLKSTHSFQTRAAASLCFLFAFIPVYLALLLISIAGVFELVRNVECIWAVRTPGACAGLG